MKKFLSIFLCLMIVWQAGAGVVLAEDIYFYHTDPVGTPLAMTNASGQKVWEADYKPFGEEFSVNASKENDRRFVGKEKDEETGLNYFGARYLSAGTGRFLAPDPVRAVNAYSGKVNLSLLVEPQRLNTYAYSLNNPSRYVDPDGEFAVEIAVVGVLLVATTVAVVSEHISQNYEGMASSAAGLIDRAKGGWIALTNGNEDKGQESLKNGSDATGKSASGQATDEYGNKLGPSGKPQINIKKHPTEKRAKDAAREESKGAPVKHPSPTKGNRHYHPSDKDGKKVPGSTHHEF